jgi:hypothetical protein
MITICSEKTVGEVQTILFTFKFLLFNFPPSTTSLRTTIGHRHHID